MPEVRLDNGAPRAPCPFCRRTRHHGWVTCSQDDDEHANLSYGVMITCRDCHICVSAEADLEDTAKYMAETAWNNCAAAPAGWKLVPVESSEKMQRAMAAQFNGTAREAMDAWAEALAATPDFKEGAE